MSQKTETQFERHLRKELRPGPSTYDPFKTSLSNIRFTMSSKNEVEEIINQTMTEQMRQSLRSLKRRPGPGEYNTLRSSFGQKDSVGQNSSAISIPK